MARIGTTGGKRSGTLVVTGMGWGGGGTGGVDPLAPGAPSLDLVAASDTGASSTDNITSDTTPDINIIGAEIWLEDDEIDIRDGGVLIVDAHVVTAGEAGGDPIALGLSALSQGAHSLTARHRRDGHSSPWSSALSITVDTTAPTITSANSGNNTENTTLAHSLTANESVTWTITGGADQARYEISGSTLRWASNGTKDFEAPNDADTNNTYVVQVTATDPAGNATNQTVTITVTDDPGDNPAGFTFWRLEFDDEVDNNGANGINLSEVEFLIDDVDQATGGTPLASSEFSGFEVAKAFDDSDATSWASDFSGNWPQWIQYEFTEPLIIDEISLQPLQAVRAPENITVKVSNNGTDFTTYDTINTGAVGDWGNQIVRNFTLTP